MEREDKEYLQWKQQRSYINTRWGQLYELEKEWGKEAIKYLMLTNAGGAVATLSFIGSSSEIRESLPPKLALLFFFIGLISSGFMIAYAYETMSRLFNGWQKDVEAHDRKEFDYDTLISRDDERVPSGVIDRVLGYMSLFSFIIGFMIGAIGLLCG
jgi:NADH:ubiquinone oxidoreductase subunit 5 (subunit L)/multisubunit Na+/H+ antiporter MnhA subunit